MPTGWPISFRARSSRVTTIHSNQPAARPMALRSRRMPGPSLGRRTDKHPPKFNHTMPDIDTDPLPVRDPFALLQELRHQIARLEAQLSEWKPLHLWGGTPEHIHGFIKGQQERIYATQDIEAQLLATRQAFTALAADALNARTALRGLLTILDETKEVLPDYRRHATNMARHVLDASFPSLP